MAAVKSASARRLDMPSYFHSPMSLCPASFKAATALAKCVMQCHLMNKETWREAAALSSECFPVSMAAA